MLHLCLAYYMKIEKNVFNVDTKLGTGAEPDKMQQLDKMTIYEAM